jgi:hypothetical protein
VPSRSELNKLSTYKNPTYGVTSVQYPSDWTIDGTNTRSNHRSAVDIVLFYPPQAKNYPPDENASSSLNMTKDITR